MDSKYLKFDETSKIVTGCDSSAKEVVIPYGVTTIGESAFFRCLSLTSIEIPNSVTEIGGGAFSGCSSLTSIAIPNTVTEIGGGTFSDCNSLTSIAIPNSVTEIGRYAFSGCSSLTSIAIPNSVTEIGEWAFDGCSSLTSINVAEDNEYFKSIDGVLFSKDGARLVAFPAGKKTTKYIIPGGVTEIVCGAFSDCPSLTSIAIPDSVTKIGSYAFSGCSSLTSIAIPNSVTKIGESAFEGCSSLREFHIRCEHPESMIFEDDPFGKKPFEGIHPDCILYVPIGTDYAYRHHEAFKGFFKEVKTEK